MDSSRFLMKLVFSAILLSSLLQISDGQQQVDDNFCVADEQFTDDELQGAMTWACQNGADCTLLQPGQACYLPNTVKDHASYAFNNYYQNMKHKGGNCYFGATAIMTARDPSHDSCKFEILP